jgi:hypothetical protein
MEMRNTELIRTLLNTKTDMGAARQRRKSEASDELPSAHLNLNIFSISNMLGGASERRGAELWYGKGVGDNYNYKLPVGVNCSKAPESRKSIDIAISRSISIDIYIDIDTIYI